MATRPTRLFQDQTQNTSLDIRHRYCRHASYPHPQTFVAKWRKVAPSASSRHGLADEEILARLLALNLARAGGK